MNECKLRGGEIVPYILCAKLDSGVTPGHTDNLNYLGVGVIYSCNGVLQHTLVEYMFWIERKKFC